MIIDPTTKSKDIIVLQRSDNNAFYGEVHISGSNLIIHVDGGGNVNADDSSSFYGLYPPPGAAGSGTTLYTASWYPITSSWATESLVAISASWANTSSWALNGGTTLITASFYEITASWSSHSFVAISSSWSSRSISSSFSDTASVVLVAYSSSFASTSFTSDFAVLAGDVYHATIADSASYFSGSILSASWADTTSWAINGGTTLITASLYPITSSWAVTASYSNVSLTSSFALNAGVSSNTYTVIATGSNADITCSLALSELYVNLTVGQLYTFTSSNGPASQSVSNTILYINNTAATTSSFSFPNAWKFIGSNPTALTASKVAVLSLKSYGDGTILASFTSQY